MLRIVPCVLLLAIPVAAGADILHVPTQYGTIGVALDSAAPFDTVLVEPGTYVENLLWPDTPGVKLLSSAGAAATIIDGGHVDQVIGIYSGVDTTTVVRGFTLQHGDAGGA